MINPSESRLNSLEVIQDPYKLYAELDSTGGIVWNTAHKSWLVGSYEYVKLLLNHPDASVEKIAPFVAHAGPQLTEKLGEMEQIMRPWVVFNDPPEHTRIRKVVQRCFMPRDVVKLEPKIRSTTTELLDEFGCKNDIDFMADFAYLLPAIVICDLFGLKRDKVEQIKTWSDGISKFVLGAPCSQEKYETGYENMMEMYDFFHDMVRGQTIGGTDGLLNRLMVKRNEPDGLSDNEIASTLVMLLFAGHETTANLLANSMLTLVRQKDKMRELMAGTVPIINAIDELLRYEGPVPVVVRVASNNIQIGEQVIHSGDRIFLLLHAANRDKRQFESPATINFERPKCPHLQFGYGTHLCLGAPLARLEGQVAFEELFKRYADFELLDKDIEWRDELMTRGPRRLRMRLTPQ